MFAGDGEPHRDVEPVEHVLGVLVLQFGPPGEIIGTVGEERDLLVGLHPSRVSWIRRRGCRSIVGTNPNRRTFPSWRVTVPHTAWNQPSRRDVWPLECTYPPSIVTTNGMSGRGNARNDRCDAVRNEYGSSSPSSSSWSGQAPIWCTRRRVSLPCTRRPTGRSSPSNRPPAAYDVCAASVASTRPNSGVECSGNNPASGVNDRRRPPAHGQVHQRGLDTIIFPYKVRTISCRSSLCAPTGGHTPRTSRSR